MHMVRLSLRMSYPFREAIQRGWEGERWGDQADLRVSGIVRNGTQPLLRTSSPAVYNPPFPLLSVEACSNAHIPCGKNKKQTTKKTAYCIQSSKWLAGSNRRHGFIWFIFSIVIKTFTEWLCKSWNLNVDLCEWGQSMCWAHRCDTASTVPGASRVDHW